MRASDEKGWPDQQLYGSPAETDVAQDFAWHERATMKYRITSQMLELKAACAKPTEKDHELDKSLCRLFVKVRINLWAQASLTPLSV